MKQMIVPSTSEDKEQSQDAAPAPNEACSLAWSAVGGLVAHLEKCLIAFQLLDQGTFDAYVPGDIDKDVSPVARSNEALDEEGAMENDDSASTGLPDFMSLDQHAIRNLEIFENTYDRGKAGMFKIEKNWNVV